MSETDQNKMEGTRNFLRARFSRGYSARYTSHLDMIRMFNRTFRRAGLPVAWSQGYNPHPVMTFALPLAVGVTSDSEVVEIGMKQDIKTEEFVERMNQHLPPGFRITACAASEGKGLMASVAAASYHILCGLDPVGEPGTVFFLKMKRAAGSLWESSRVLVEKLEARDGRKESKTVDIRPMILRLGCTEQAPDRILMQLLCAAGSVANLRPDLFLKALDSFTDGGFQILGMHRNGLFARRDGHLADLLTLNIDSAAESTFCSAININFAAGSTF